MTIRSSLLALGSAIAAAAILASGAPAGAATPVSTGSAGAARTDFAAQARTAGLDSGEASALQDRVDAYLARFGAKAATQADFNTIALAGADLHVTVPGETRPRGIQGTCSYKYFCAYSGERQTGDEIHMYSCNPWFIPWVSTGSWVNNQTSGTRPLLTFLDGSTWRMPAAYASQLTGVGWNPVNTIDPC